MNKGKVKEFQCITCGAWTQYKGNVTFERPGCFTLGVCKNYTCPQSMFHFPVVNFRFVTPGATV